MSATRRESGPIRLTLGWRLNSDAIIDGSAQPLPLDSYLPMLYPLIPEPPAVQT